MKSRKLTDKQYVEEYFATFCPVCKTDAVNKAPIINPTSACPTSTIVRCQCRACFSTWNDVWKLTQYDDLVTPEQGLKKLQETLKKSPMGPPRFLGINKYNIDKFLNRKKI